MDNRTPAKRREIMATVRTKNTGPELIVRKLLSSRGFRYRLHRKDLPGCPDIVFPASKRVLLVHGCFWHGHRCAKGRLPKARLSYWKPKIEKNVKRDEKNAMRLIELGWKVMTVWQCELKDMQAVAKKIELFLSQRTYGTVTRGRQSKTGKSIKGGGDGGKSKKSDQGG